jgi:hypothetical protein
MVIGVAPGVEEDVAAQDEVDVGLLSADQLKVIKVKCQEEYLATNFVLQPDKR